jgi:signal transduction histidine kinase
MTKYFNHLIFRFFKDNIKIYFICLFFILNLLSFSFHYYLFDKELTNQLFLKKETNLKKYKLMHNLNLIKISPFVELAKEEVKSSSIIPLALSVKKEIPLNSSKIKGFNLYIQKYRNTIPLCRDFNFFGKYDIKSNDIWFSCLEPISFSNYKAYIRISYSFTSITELYYSEAKFLNQKRSFNIIHTNDIFNKNETDFFFNKDKYFLASNLNNIPFDRFSIDNIPDSNFYLTKDFFDDMLFIDFLKINLISSLDSSFYFVIYQNSDIYMDLSKTYFLYFFIVSLLITLFLILFYYYFLITEKNKALITINHFSSIGKLIGNITHQWKQPINNLKRKVSELSMNSITNQMSEDDLLDQYDVMAEQIDYLSNTIDDFTFYFKSDENQIIKFNDLFSKALQLAKYNNLIESDNLEFSIESHDIEFFGSEGQLFQVLISIVNNALFEIRNIDKPLLSISSIDTKKYVVIEIFNNGRQIPASTFKTLFDYGFTSKKEGTGMGLFMAQEIISSLFNGYISAENKSNGVSFKIFLKK